MAGRKAYLVWVPITKYIPIAVEGSPDDMASILESAGATARFDLSVDVSGIEVVHSSRVPWIVANRDGSSPNKFEKIVSPGDGEKWFRYDRNTKRGYGY